VSDVPNAWAQSEGLGPDRVESGSASYSLPKGRRSWVPGCDQIELLNDANVLANRAESSLGPCGSELIDDLAVRVEKRNTGRSVWCDL
jgi:hypothetical protein